MRKKESDRITRGSSFLIASTNVWLKYCILNNYAFYPSLPSSKYGLLGFRFEFRQDFGLPKVVGRVFFGAYLSGLAEEKRTNEKHFR